MMTAPILEYICNYLARQNAPHVQRIRSLLSKESADWKATAASFFERYKIWIEGEGKSLDYGLDCYLKLVSQMLHERIKFLRSGKYVSSSFADVEEQIYRNPTAFEYHMHGLVFAQFFWPEQAARFRFFSHRIGDALAGGGKYLEVGGGHGLYIIEAIRRAPPDTLFRLVDISPSSMKLAQGTTAGLAIEFSQINILNYDSPEKFNFITVGEVIEHLEDPLQLLVKVREMLNPDGKAFISAPTNSPTIDHIYLFHEVEEIRNMLRKAGLQIAFEEIYAENVDEARARKLKLSVMFAAFVVPM